ncbi:uncharacterized protein LOC119107227 [Pollicipes pollicipes]|uniref:uncharacterized protein LOC119107227 n=1 Tax=Pollicipes pollicipes TaxID=41117 RepID=UPI0018856480|nr:uncharacterized protein LOC119107227 [Pollicipes pollicipes]
MWRGPRMEVDLIRAGLRGYVGFLRHYSAQHETARRLEALQESARDLMIVGMHGGGTLRSVCHGDLWKLNMMFRYPADEPAGAPDGVMLLDWQHCHVGNFLVDLFSVLVNNTDAAFRRRHTADVLRFFHDELALALREAGLQPSDVGLSHEQLVADYQASKKAALMRVIFDVVLPLAADDATSGADPGAPPEQLVDRLVEAMAVKTTDQQLERLLLELADEMSEQGVI